MTLKEFLEQILYLLATGIMPVLTVYIVMLLKTKIKEYTTMIDNEQLESYVNTAVDVIGMVVIQVNQTFVNELKKKGEFTPEAAIEAKNRAIEECKKLISENSKMAIETLYNDFDAYLNSKIEELVNENKLSY